MQCVCSRKCKQVIFSCIVRRKDKPIDDGDDDDDNAQKILSRVPSRTNNFEEDAKT